LIAKSLIGLGCFNIGFCGIFIHLDRNDLAGFLRNAANVYISEDGDRKPKLRIAYVDAQMLEKL